MKKFYKIFLLLLILIFLSTYTPNKLSFFSNIKNFFFEIQEIEVVNNHIINKDEIINKLTHIYGKNIIFVDRSNFEESLQSINFLERIEVKKRYPSMIIIKVYETKPVAILFKANDKYLLDSSSNLITFNQNIIDDSFPNIFGEGAEYNFINFSNQLKNNNFPKERIKNYYYFQIGRWDLQLSNDQIIKFPEKETVKAIQQSVELLSRKDFENYNIIDLRIHGKIIVE